MNAASSRAPRAVIAGRVLTGLAVAFLLFSSLLKFFAPTLVRETMVQLGFPPQISIWLGVLELACTLLYALPATARVGVVLLTGYLGGAVATHLRLLDPWLTHTLFPVWLGALAWAGLLLRDARLRAVLLAWPRRACAAA
ncbi:MAG TPA: DoxX family protein [Planctomycetota bacterium]|nr:DoxX family protein [Planctomycetota bacterium]